jgi:hypothetical protein
VADLRAEWGSLPALHSPRNLPVAIPMHYPFPGEWLPDLFINTGFPERTEGVLAHEPNSRDRR